MPTRPIPNVPNHPIPRHHRHRIVSGSSVAHRLPLVAEIDFSGNLARVGLHCLECNKNSTLPGLQQALPYSTLLYSTLLYSRHASKQQAAVRSQLPSSGPASMPCTLSLAPDHMPQQHVGLGPLQTRICGAAPVRVYSCRHPELWPRAPPEAPRSGAAHLACYMWSSRQLQGQVPCKRVQAFSATRCECWGPRSRR